MPKRIKVRSMAELNLEHAALRRMYKRKEIPIGEYLAKSNANTQEFKAAQRQRDNEGSAFFFGLLSFILFTIGIGFMFQGWWALLGVVLIFLAIMAAAIAWDAWYSSPWDFTPSEQMQNDRIDREIKKIKSNGTLS